MFEKCDKYDLPSISQVNFCIRHIRGWKNALSFIPAASWLVLLLGVSLMNLQTTISIQATSEFATL